jgi:outer membrane protein assembly factor BamB
MLKILCWGAILLGVFFVFGCGASPSTTPRTSGTAKERDSLPAPEGNRWAQVSIVSEQLLKAAELELVWANKVAMRKGETLKQLFIAGENIYSLSSGNYITALNRQKGTMIFSRELSPAGFPVVGWELYNDVIFSVVGNELVEIDPRSGKELSAMRLDVGAACAAARNRSYFYIGGTDRRVHTLRADDKVRFFRVSAENDSAVVSLVADEDFVVFATDGGNVVSFTADGPRQLWQFYAAEAIVGPIARDVSSVFVASKDTNVYRLDLGTGKLIWKYRTAAVLDRGPVVTGSVVYQYVRDKVLAAIDKESGGDLWQLAGGVDLLAEGGGKAYVITNERTLVVMDNNTGKQLYSVNFAGVSRCITNTQDLKMYIANEDGRVACVKPIEDR